MNILLAIFLFLPGYCYAGLTPIPTGDKKVDSNLAEIALDLQRNSLKNGGTVKQALSVSSSLYVGGNAFLDGDTRVSTLTVTNTATFNGLTNLGQVLIASGTFDLAASVSMAFPALISSGVYRFSFFGVKDGTTGTVLLRFNGDSGSTYDTANTYMTTAGTSGNDAGQDTSHCYLYHVGASWLANGVGSGEYIFAIHPGDNTRISGSGHYMFDNDTANSFDSVKTTCHYDGGAAITSIELVGGTGGVGGYMNLVRIR